MLYQEKSGNPVKDRSNELGPKKIWRKIFFSLFPNTLSPVFHPRLALETKTFHPVLDSFKPNVLSPHFYPLTDEKSRNPLLALV
jgi:hypothetical protein